MKNSKPNWFWTQSTFTERLLVSKKCSKYCIMWKLVVTVTLWILKRKKSMQGGSGAVHSIIKSTSSLLQCENKSKSFLTHHFFYAWHTKSALKYKKVHNELNNHVKYHTLLDSHVNLILPTDKNSPTQLLTVIQWAECKVNWK